MSAFSGYLVNGVLTDSEGLSYETSEEFLQSAFGFCGCGMPEYSLKYILDGLEIIDYGKTAPGSGKGKWEKWYEEYCSKQLAHFKTDGARYFFFYWCHREGLTEHGGSVPGWLSEYGEEVLNMLREWESKELEIAPDGTCDKGQSR